ncbi:hypothetical protein [Ensifer adhaerens]|nr:hypothetical protein [Ensifer sp. ENS01]
MNQEEEYLTAKDQSDDFRSKHTHRFIPRVELGITQPVKRLLMKGKDKTVGFHAELSFFPLFCAAAADLALKWKLSFCGFHDMATVVRRSSKAVILASPKTVAHSLKLRLVDSVALVALRVEGRFTWLNPQWKLGA